MPNINFATKKSSDNITIKKLHKILIVDDDESIHEVTSMALKSMKFSNFEIKILKAYSATQAQEILEDEKDIALALIDVVMETPEAGLNLVNHIRNKLQNKLIRLIIRTGQANDFPQMQVIQRYDINDFKEKTELTLERLYTTIRTSVTQYEQLLDLQKKYEETYTQMTTNPLTLLPNRIKLLEDFSKSSKQTLILIDIIGFSIINDTNGYDVGDFVLKELGGFLFSMYGTTFKVYHLNTDIFALVPRDYNLQNIVETVETIKKDISKLNIITDNFHKTIDTTIGVAFQSENDIMKKAELALKEARNTGKNQIKFYSNDLKVIKQVSNTNHWAPIIQNALIDNRIMAYEQPIYNISTNTIEKYELLVRLEENGEVYSPYHFLDAAHNSGQLYNIFKFMFTQGCRLHAKTGKKYSINISDCELHNETLVDDIKAILSSYATNPTFISLEILESNAITQSSQMREKITALQELGIEFVIDDFGVQCSNFAQAEFIPINILKIDGSFIKNLDTSRNSQIIVKTIQTFAREKNLKLVAEFVCDENIYNKVKELGIDYAQGYYLGKPEPVE